MDKNIKLGFKSVISLSLALYLSACTHNVVTTVPVTTAPLESQQSQQLWQKHQQELSNLHAFRVNGSMAYLSGKTKNYARFFLDQKAINTYDLKLTNPLGGTVMLLKSRPGTAEIITQDGEKYQGKNTEELVNRLTAMNIPLQSLYQWLIGLSNNPQADKVDAQGRLQQTQITENGNTWMVNIPAYTEQQRIALPSTIELTQQETKIRLKISNWTL